METVPYLGETLTRWKVGNSTFLALPERGARLMNWHVTLGDGSVRDVLYWPELSTLDDVHKVRGGNPILFPFNARTFDRGKIHTWRANDGVHRPMPMHGIARQGLFKTSHANERGFSAVFQPGAEARECYPYDYEFKVVYRFSSLGLICEFVLTNHDKQPIPWSAGHHFYFTLPWSEGLQRKDYTIRIPATKTVKQDTAGQLVAGPQLTATERMDNPNLIDTIHYGLKTNEVTFGPADGRGQISVKIGSERKPPAEATFVTWTLDETVPYYCVEPWMGPPNAAEHKVGLHWVHPGQSQSFAVEISLK
ncbi:MAG TPA: aldose epimerase [Opitutaceae bacterium]|nr:aldose epimerase [Opitutaceae bacterium]